MRYQFLILTIIMSCSTPSKKTQVEEAAVIECLSTREFVTTVEFLRKQDDFKMDDGQIQMVASKVSSGCTGAAQNFVDATNLLIKSGVDSKAAIETATSLSVRGREATQSFMTIFRYAYLEDGLDLDLNNSLVMAKSLSVETIQDHKKVEKDFKNLIIFCTSKSKLKLPLGTCGAMAARVTLLAAQYSDAIAEPFIEIFDFVTEDKQGPKLSLFDGLVFAEKVIRFGPKTKDNFIQAYRYALSNDGLKFENNKALDFAFKMAELSTKIDKK